MHTNRRENTSEEATATETGCFRALVQIILYNWHGNAQSTAAGAAPDVPHHKTASAKPNPRVEDTFVNTHATETSGTKSPTTCVEFNCAKRDPSRISEEENRVIRFPNDILRCHSLHRFALPGVDRSHEHGS